MNLMTGLIRPSAGRDRRARHLHPKIPSAFAASSATAPNSTRFPRVSPAISSSTRSCASSAGRHEECDQRAMAAHRTVGLHRSRATARSPPTAKACASASNSRRPSRTIRRSSSSTNRSTDSIRSPAPKPSRSSRSGASTAATSSSPATSCTKWTASPIRSSCSARATSSPKARSRASAAKSRISPCRSWFAATARPTRRPALSADHVVEAKLHTDGHGLLLRTRDADGFYLLLNKIVLETGLVVESVAPADDDVNSVYQYLIGGEGSTI